MLQLRSALALAVGISALVAMIIHRQDSGSQTAYFQDAYKQKMNMSASYVPNSEISASRPCRESAPCQKASETVELEHLEQNVGKNHTVAVDMEKTISYLVISTLAFLFRRLNSVR